MAKLTPLSDRVILKQVPYEQNAASSLIMPDNLQKPPPHGIVVAAGPGKLLDNGNLAPMDVEVGHKVIFDTFRPQITTIDGEEFVILRQTDIMAIIE